MADLESALPAGLQLTLYRLALDRGHLGTMLDRYLVGWLRRPAPRPAGLGESSKWLI